MTLFTIGPSQMYGEIIEIKKQLVPYFRTEDFSEKMLYVSSMLKRTMYAESCAETIILTSSGTGAMEAVVMNCFTSKDRLLIINGGTFGKRFCQICDIHKIPYDSIELKFCEILSSEHFLPYENKNYSALLVNLHETSTGQLYDIRIISEFCKRNGMFLIVDAISTYLCDDYNMTQYGIDATIISSQKGLCCSPGISFVVMSSRMNKYRKQNHVKSYYYNFSDYINNFTRGQTPFTPAVGVLLEVYSMMKKVEKEGINSLLNRVQENALFFRRKIGNIPLCTMPSYPLSSAITPVLFDEPIAQELFEYLRREKDIYVNPCGGKMSHNMIRVAHIGDLSIIDHQVLLDSIVEFIKEI